MWDMWPMSLLFVFSVEGTNLTQDDEKQKSTLKMFKTKEHLKDM